MTPANLAVLGRLIQTHSGVVVGADKLYLLESRLGGLVREQRLPSLDALAFEVARAPDGALAHRVVEAMTTNETSFFRDPATFAHLAAEILPRLRAARAPGTRIAIWSAAASTGQEALSVAMLLKEMTPSWPSSLVSIVATDIARAPLARAEAGLYSAFEVQRGLSAERLALHFCREGEAWRALPDLRARTTFRRFNLLNDPLSLGRFDVVFLRNVLIYFDATTRKRVLGGISRQLAPDGVLYLGAAETLLGVTDLFAPVPGHPGAFVPQAGAKSN